MPARTLTAHPGHKNHFHFGGFPPFFTDMVALAESLRDVDPYEADPYDVDPSTSRSAIHRKRAILLDLKETEDTVEVRADIPGISKQDINVDIEKNVLTLKVDHEENTQESHSAPPQQADAADASAPVTWHRTERSRMFVKRSVVLPESADTATAHASYVDGVLAITFPRKPVVDSATKLVIN